LAFDAGGDLFVAGNVSDNVVRFDGATGAFLGVFASGIPGANGLAFAENGDLFVASETGDTIYRIDRATGASEIFATVDAPIGIALPEPSLGLVELAAAASLAGLAACRRRRRGR